jgi:hypothetical protein
VGISKAVLAPYQQLLQTDTTKFNRYPVTRELLAKLNEQGESGLGVRRKLLKFEISACVFSRGGQVRGLFISYTDFTEAAIAQCRDAIVQGRVVILSTLEEIVSLLNQEGDMKAWLKAKLEAAIVDKQPFVHRLN